MVQLPKMYLLAENLEALGINRGQIYWIIKHDQGPDARSVNFNHQLTYPLSNAATGRCDT